MSLFFSALVERASKHNLPAQDKLCNCSVNNINIHGT